MTLSLSLSLSLSLIISKPTCTLKLHVPFNNYIQAHLSVNKADAQGVPWFWDRSYLKNGS